MKKSLWLAAITALAVSGLAVTGQNTPNGSTDSSGDNHLNFNSDTGGPAGGSNTGESNSYGPGTPNHPGSETITKTNSNQNLYFNTPSEESNQEDTDDNAD